MLKFITENAIPLSAAFIALVALLAAIYHGYATRRHFRVSVRPHLKIEMGKKIDENLFHITIINQGLGPAIIKNFTIIKEEKEIHPKEADEFLNLVEATIKMPRDSTAISLPHRNESLSPNNSIPLIKNKPPARIVK